MKAVIFAGGDFDTVSVEAGTFVVCADGGYKNAVRAGVIPDLLIGDMDSIGSVPDNIPVIKANPKKDETDTQLCIDYLAEKGYNDISIVCALGGRLDHELANVALVAYGVKKGINVTLCTKNANVFAIKGKTVIKGRRGDIFSMFPIGGDCEGIYTKGLEYELSGGRLEYDVPMGISNVLTENEASVLAKKGILIAIHFKGEQT